MSLVVLAPRAHSLTPFYSDAALDFWRDRREPADYLNGFYYLPAARVLFTPFALIGNTAGGLAWRLFGFGLVALAAWRWAKTLASARWTAATCLILWMTISPSAAVFRNGQFDAPTWALIALGGAFAAEERPWAAAIALSLALALKPIAIAPLLMFAVLRPAIGLRSIPLVAVALALPFVNPDWGYVLRLYGDWLSGLTGALPQPGRWNDLANVLAATGLGLPYGAATLVRIAAAIGALALGALAVRRLPRAWADFEVLAIATLYLLLFNPRTEGSSYIGLGLVAAVLAARLMLVEGRIALGWVLVGMCALIGLGGVSREAMALSGVWLRPLLAVVCFLAVILPRALDAGLWSRKTPFSEPARERRLVQT
jgi:hypothetical protein